MLNRPLAIVTKPDLIQRRCKKSSSDFDTTRSASRARHISPASRPAMVARLRPPAGDAHRDNLRTRVDDCIVSNPPILAAAPGCVVTLTVVAVVFIGNALRDALDVR